MNVSFLGEKSVNQFYKIFIVTTIIFNTSASYGSHSGKMTASAGKGGSADSAVKAARSTPSISAESPHKGKTGSAFLPGFVGPKTTGTISPSIDERMRAAALQYRQDRVYLDSEGRRNYISYSNKGIRETISSTSDDEVSQQGDH